MTLPVLLDVLVVVLLATAIVVAFSLNRRLAAFRAAKAEFEQVIERFNIAAASRKPKWFFWGSNRPTTPTS